MPAAPRATMIGLFSRVRSLARGLWRRGALDAEMAEEFRHHVQLRTEDLVRSGMPRDAAARRARIEFGSVARFTEEGREARGLRLLTEIAGDLRYASRSLRAAPAFTIAAVLIIGLGTGANAAIFSLVSAHLLRPPPFAGAGRLVVLYQTRSDGTNVQRVRWSYPEFTAATEAMTSLSSVAAYYADDVNLSGDLSAPVRVRAEMVSASYFPVLGVQPVAGRSFVPAEDSVPGAAPVMMLAHGLWSREFGGDSAVLGRPVRLNGVAMTIVGVAPPGFSGLTGDAQVWFPQAMAPLVSYPEQLTSPQHFHSVIGRLRPGVPVEQAHAELSTAGAAAAARMHGALGGDAEEMWGAGLMPLQDATRHPATARGVLVLAGAAVFVLLIAVVNLSGLFLARAVAKARERAVRTALGASRGRLLRQGLVEGGLLGMSGGIVGLLLAWWIIAALLTMAPARLGEVTRGFADLAAFAEPVVDWRVVVFGSVVALAASMIAGLASPLRTITRDPARALRVGARGSSASVGSLRRPTVLSTAAVVQVACALVLLAGSALLLEAFQRLRSTDAGFDSDGVLTFELTPPVSVYGGAEAAPLLERVLERVSAVPGVNSASVSLCVPYRRCSSTPLYVEGREPPAEPPIVGRHYVGPEHFVTLGIPLRRGRALTAADRAGTPRVAVINESAARRFWPGEDPIGKRVWFGGGGGFASPDSLTEIVGVVGDVLYTRPGGEMIPDFYTSYLQFTWPYTTVIARIVGDPGMLVPALRRAVADIDPDLPIHDVRTMREISDEALAGERFATRTVAMFAALALVLVALGIYGIIGYSVAQRRREIGIRLALGATSQGIVRHIVRQGATLAAVGLVAGAAVSVLLARALSALVAGSGSLHAPAFAAAVAILLLVALVASYLPATGAARVTPVETLGAE